MFTPSRFISSAQTGPHEDLLPLLQRHLAHPFLKPITAYSAAAFAEGMALWRTYAASTGGQPVPLILDAGCGVGWSTINLARAYPDCFVLGVDCSEDRIGRRKTQLGDLPANCGWVRADLVDFWRLLAQAGVRLQRHYVLYPNPWPKIGHLQRRWQGHPVFTVLPQLGGVIECRSNWQIYIEEFALALQTLTGQPVACAPWHPVQPMTPFEQKYQQSGHDLWRCTLDFAVSGDVRPASLVTDLPDPQSTAKLLPQD